MPATPRNITTASSVDGWAIVSHHGVVAAHVVAGTGLFSDWLAGLSDIFGGRSGSYQNQLESLYAEALQKLVRKAEATGANWVVGLSVDIDEISGKGTQMFMITAVGTAVTAHRQEKSPLQARNPEAAAVGDVRNQLRRKRLVRILEDPDYAINDGDWEFVVENRMEEAAPRVLTWIETNLAPFAPDQWPPAMSQKVLAYLQAIPSPAASDLLYRALQLSAGMGDAAIRLIEMLSLGNLSAISAVIGHPDPVIRRRGLLTLGADQPSYSLGDLATIDALLAAIPGAFPDRSKLSEEQRFRGSAKQRWTCAECERANALDAAYCVQCHRDPRGFRESQLNPEFAIQILKDRRDAIVTILGGESASPASA